MAEEQAASEALADAEREYWDDGSLDGDLTWR